MLIAAVISGGIDPNWLLAKGTETGNISWICRALALGADRNTVAGSDLKRAPIHLAVLSVTTHIHYLDAFKWIQTVEALAGYLLMFSRCLAPFKSNLRVLNITIATPDTIHYCGEYLE